VNNNHSTSNSTSTRSSQRNNGGITQAGIRRARIGRRALWLLFGLYVVVFIIYLYAPLIVTGVLAFNNSDIPSFPWKGLTLDWFYNPNYGKVEVEDEDETEAAGQIGIGRTGGRVGVFNDQDLLGSIKNSFIVAVAVTALSLVVGTTTALLFERNRFKGDTLLYFAMLAPLVIPGVILGVSILVFGNSIVGPLRAIFGRETVKPIVSLLRPGLFIVVLGQFAWIATMATLIISARLRRFPMVQEDAAMDLGASRFKAITSITIPFLRPALFSAGVVAFLLSFENFGTTLFLIGSDPTLPILFFSRLRFEITPQINAVSVVLILGTILLGLAALGLEQLRSSGRG
jgi:spermidine/putrescine transport system permease protein